MNKRIGMVLLLLGLLSTATSQAGAAQLIMSAPPRESRIEGERLYGPLARHLAKITGQSVRYRHPGNWFKYQRDMRRGKYDIVLDGPQFVSWRRLHLQHEVLVRLPGQLEYYLLAKKEDGSVNALHDLARKRICAIAPPDLSILTVLDRYRNPVRQPVLVEIKDDMAKVYQAFTQGKCRAAVLSTGFYRKGMTQAQRDASKILFHSKPRPNLALSVSPKLDAKARQKIIRSLTSRDGAEASKAILKRFAGESVRSFVPAKGSEYDRHHELLEGVVFGW